MVKYHFRSYLWGISDHNANQNDDESEDKGLPDATVFDDNSALLSYLLNPRVTNIRQIVRIF